MISATSRPYIQASVSVLQEIGGAITNRFYASMLGEHPELNHIFNQGNQASQAQQRSLASAVFAYAANIDNPDVLAPVIDRIAHKHASIGIRSHHYPIVGRHLLQAIADEVGAQAATAALMAAWDEAYWLLAGALIEAESRLYLHSGAQPGALMRLRIAAVEPEAQGMISMLLTQDNDEGGSPGPFVPGQYVSVEVVLPHSGLRQRRQYSLSDAPGKPYWRITVKREPAAEGRPQGEVSNWLHAHAQAGGVLNVSPAFGEFRPAGATVDSDLGHAPVVLIAAGVGITPMVSWLNDWAARWATALQAGTPAGDAPPSSVHLLYAARSANHHPLQKDVRTIQQLVGSRLQTWTVYESPDTDTDTDAVVCAPDAWGRLQLQTVLPERLGDVLPRAQVALCGPGAFMSEQFATLRTLGVPAQQIHREVFGPEMFA